MSINLFLDTNIYLSFYSLSNADIAQLAELQKAVQKGEISLFVNDQVNREVARNRENKIRESFKALKDSNLKCQAPAFAKSMKEFQELQDILKQANKKHSDLIALIDTAVAQRDLEADKLIEEIFTTAKPEAVAEKTFMKALKRHRVGDPPGKNSSTIGDQIHWEHLLEKVSEGEDLHLVSSDGDFASQLDESRINPVLENEWKAAKKSNLFFYKDLPIFFKQHLPAIKLATQAKLSALISELSASSSFADTHAIIAKFPEGPEFTDAHIADLMNIYINNSQVNWISEDGDVAALFGPVKERYKEILKNQPAEAETI